MRYGTVPIVRETGGLKDTVQPYESWRDSGNGFTFANYASSDMLYVINSAVYLYKDYPDAFARLRQRAMESDFSWARSARAYMGIYAKITGQIWPVPETVEEEAAPAKESVPETVPETVPVAEEPAPVEEAVPAPAEEAVSEPAPAEVSLPVEEPALAKEPEETVKEDKKPAKKASKPTTKKESSGKKTSKKKA
jgi:starch synthase